jgi:hypothetical protein
MILNGSQIGSNKSLIRNNTDIPLGDELVDALLVRMVYRLVGLARPEAW